MTERTDAFDRHSTSGYVGIPGNIPDGGAGWAQGQAGTSLPQWGNWWDWPSSPTSFGDDPADQHWINEGIKDYENGYYSPKYTNKMQRFRNMTACFMLFGFLALAGCEKNDLCVGDEISRTSSPDKRVDAVVTKGSCGATTSYTCRVFVVQAGKTPIESDMIFLADKAKGVSVSWQAPKKLVISYKEARIFKFTNFWSSKEFDNFQYIISAVEVQRD